MAFNDIEFQAVKKEVERFVESIRPAPDARDEYDIVFSVKEQTVEITEERAIWQGKPGEKCQVEIAKITFSRTRNIWKLYWMRANLKWGLYEEVATLTSALSIIRADEHGCFFG